MHHPDLLGLVVQACQVRTQALTCCPRLVPVLSDAGLPPDVAAVPVQVPSRRTGRWDVLDVLDLCHARGGRGTREDSIKLLTESVRGEREADTAGGPVTAGGAADPRRCRRLGHRSCGDHVQPADVRGAGQQRPAEEEHGRRTEEGGHRAPSGTHDLKGGAARLRRSCIVYYVTGTTKTSS